MQDPPDKPLTYADAGVDIKRGAALVERIKPAVKTTFRNGVIGGLGGFGGLYQLASASYSEPILVSSTDGVGTKLMLAIALARHDTIGIDLVAMCVNDIVVQGAEPLFFLDYFACGRLDVATATTVIEGIAAGCRQAGAALLGGETAEMPALYAEGHYDLAGFAVGVVEAAQIIDGRRVSAGDVILGLASEGLHANGYSLVRGIIERDQIAYDFVLGEQILADALLRPTRIYVPAVLKVSRELDLHALAHITGGGISDNLPRVLPPHTCANIDLDAWRPGAIFEWLQLAGPVSEAEMLRTFNCGLGMLVVVAPAAVPAATKLFTEAGESVYEIGRIASHDGAPTVKYAGSLF